MKYLIIFILILVVVSCSKEADDLNQPKLANDTVTPQDIATLKVYVYLDNVPSDNYSYAMIFVTTADPAVFNKIKSIKFTTDKGTFSNDLKEYTINVGLDTAKAFLKCNKPELAKVTVTIPNKYSKELFVHFSPSWPDQIFIEPALNTLPASYSSQTLIKARLIRNIGSVSEGQSVQFYDSTSSNKSVGIFLNITQSNGLGEATSQYWIQDTTFHGFVYIKGYVLTDKIKVIGMNRILIQ